MFPDLLPTWLPDGLRPAFAAARSAAARRTPPEWDALWATKRAALQKLLHDLAGCDELEDWEIFLMGDPELFLFYVMKVQRAVALVLRLPDEAWVPGRPDECWRWMMTLRPGESWLEWFAPPPRGTAIPFWPYAKE